MTESTGTAPDQAETNRALVTRLFESWTAGEFDAARALFADDATMWTAANRATVNAQHSLQTFEDRYREATKGFRFEVHELTAEGDRVAAVVESWADFPERGPYNNIYHFLFRIEHGQIVQAWEYYDTALSNRVFRGVR